MATYTTVETFQRDRWPTGSNVDRKFVQSAADDAYTAINSALDEVYSVPFSSPYPGIIVFVSDMLTRVLAEFIIGTGRLPTIDKTEDKTSLNPLNILNDLRTGDRSIPGLARKTTTDPWVSTEDVMHIFDVDHEIFHDADPDRLDDLADDRTSYP